MLDRINEMFDFQTKALVLRAERQKVIAGNIANSDTPRFQAVDFNFADALRAATGHSGSTDQKTVAPLATAITNARHLAAGGAGLLAHATLAYRNPPQAAIDNNTVDLDQERGQFADNSVRYEATLRFITGQIRTMNQAITGNGQ